MSLDEDRTPIDSQSMNTNEEYDVTLLRRLIRRIDQLLDEFARLDMTTVVAPALTQLDRSRCHAHQMIDQVYDSKAQQIRRYASTAVNEEIQLMEKLRTAMITGIPQQPIDDVELMADKIAVLQQRINDIKRMTVELNIIPFVFDERSVDMEMSLFFSPDLSRVLSPFYERIDRLPLSSDVIASCDQFVLMHQNSNLILIDVEFAVIGQRHWPHEWIRDMCWSSSCNGFFLVTFHRVYLIHVDTLAIETIGNVRGYAWQSCTCSDNALYLTKDMWNSSIEQYSLTRPISFVNEWSIQSNDDVRQRIDSIVCRHGTLAVTHNRPMSQEITIELRSLDTFELLWSCSLDGEHTERKLRCCSFSRNQWLLIDQDTSTLITIDKDGQVDGKVRYPFDVHRVTTWSCNLLILSTSETFNFHKL
jgi:hypothetical protein